MVAFCKVTSWKLHRVLFSCAQNLILMSIMSFLDVKMMREETNISNRDIFPT